MNNVRKLVFSSLRSCAESDRYTNLEADSVIKREGLTGNDKDFYTALLYGVTERGVTLEYIIEVLTGKSIGKLQKNVQLLKIVYSLWILILNPFIFVNCVYG